MPFTNKGRELQLAAVTTAAPAGPVLAMLVRKGHAFAIDADWLDSIVADEIVATGYARVAATFDAPVRQADGSVTLTIVDTAFGVVGGALNATVAGCYLFADTGDPATSPLIACVPFAEEILTDGTPLTVRWPLSTMTNQPSRF